MGDPIERSPYAHSMTTRPLIRPWTDPNERKTGPMLVFYRAAGEGVQYPDDVVNLLNAEGVKTGMLRARNPVTHDQWWIPVVALAAAGAPYAKALASVIQTWLKEQRGRQVRLENGRSKVTANTAADAERLLAALTKHAKRLGTVHVTKARKLAAKKKPTGKRIGTRKK
jgi:hypothetical protein